MEEVTHKKYLNDWFTGKWPGSPARGELYNDDPRLGDARLCGTTASLCGLESAQTPEETALALACDVMLHAWMLTQSGIPVLYSGDEIGQLNDHSYHLDPEKRADSRYLHRGDFDWEKAALRVDLTTYQGRLFAALRKLERIRASERVFRADAKISTFDTGSDCVLGVCRELDGERFLGLFHFGENPTHVFLGDIPFIDLVENQGVAQKTVHLPAYGFLWLKEAKG